VKGEQKEPPWLALRAGVVLGTKAFLERARKVAQGDEREQPGLKAIRVQITFEDVVRAMEKEKGESWEQFRDRHGDLGRDLVLVVARRKCGMTHNAIGKAAGDLRAVAVNIAIRRMVNRLLSDNYLRQIYQRITSRM